jgi:hypothetical protein
MEQDLSVVKKIFGKYEEGFKKQENKDPYDQENIFLFLIYCLMRTTLDNQEQTKVLDGKIIELDLQFQNLARKYNEVLALLNNKEDKKIIKG